MSAAADVFDGEQNTIRWSNIDDPSSWGPGAAGPALYYAPVAGYFATGWPYRLRIGAPRYSYPSRAGELEAGIIAAGRVPLTAASLRHGSTKPLT